MNCRITKLMTAHALTIINLQPVELTTKTVSLCKKCGHPYGVHGSNEKKTVPPFYRCLCPPKGFRWDFKKSYNYSQNNYRRAKFELDIERSKLFWAYLIAMGVKLNEI